MINKKDVFSSMALRILAIVMTIACFYRIFLGVEITDEILAIAETDLLIQGATPFVDNWLQTPGFTIFIAGLIKLYKLVNKSYEGIFLFTRFMFLLYRILITLVLCKMLKYLSISKNYRIAVYTIMIPIYFYVPNFHYNSISNSLLLLSGIYLCWIYQNFEKRINHLTIVGGIYALCVYCHPSEFLPTLMTAILIIICPPPKKKSKCFYSLLRYASGGIIVAVSLSIWMILRGKGINKLIFGLDSILNYNPYFMIPKDSLIQSIRSLLTYSAPIAFIILFIYFLKIILNKLKIEVFPFFYDMIFFLMSLFFVLYAFQGIILLSSLCIILLFYFVWRLSWFAKNKITLHLFYFICLPIIFSTLSISFFSHGSIINRLLFMLPTIFIIIVTLSTWKLNENIKSLSLFIITLLFSCIVLKSNYTYIYRDSPIIELKSKIHSGIYEGIYTTESRKQTLMLFEAYLSDSFTENDHVLFMETTPFAYLMTDAKACTPSTWDISLYSYNFNDDSLYQRYFETTNTIPDYIMYIDTGRDAMLSINKDNYNFTQYVKSNYILLENKTLGDWQVICYKRSNA